MESKEFLQSHRELVRLKIAAINAAQADLQSTLNTIAIELGLNPAEPWRLSQDGAAFEKAEPKKG